MDKDRSKLSRRSRLARWLRRLVVVAAFLAGAEVTCRLDDAIHLDVPLLATPDHERDLMVHEAWGTRGKPGGHFQQWKLNSFGFRGPEIAREPPAGTTRIMVLGASETFGLLESPGMEFPAQLQRQLGQDGAYEVLNAGIAGCSLKAMIPFWDHWGSEFHPHIVLIYPTPLFYLRFDPPAPPRPEDGPHGGHAATGFHSRFYDRITGTYRTLPLWIRNLRRDLMFERQIAGKPPSWFFPSVPQDRLDLFEEDATRLIERIRECGAVPIFVTHATSAVSPPRPEDRMHLRNVRFDFAWVTIEIIAGFEVEANETLRRVARQNDVQLIDASREFSGRRELFGDLMHFNDGGAKQMARLLAEQIRRD